MIEWIEEYYGIITKIIVPIIVAIIGIFTVRSIIKKKNIIKGNDNITLVSDADINNNQSFNTNTVNQTAGDVATQVAGDNYQIGSIDKSTIQLLAQAFNKDMYPYAERAFEKFRLNSQNFLVNFNAQLEKLSQPDLNKFSEADVQMALHNAIQGAGRTDSIQVHEILGRLIADRVQKPKKVIAELAINESIEVAAKLDVNLIKILAFSFLFSRTKSLGVPSEAALIGKLTLIAAEFKDLDISHSKFEYLEAISCGKMLQFLSGDLIGILSQSYPHLFHKKISLQQVTDLALPESIQNVCFLKQEEDVFQLNPNAGLYLFEVGRLMVNGLEFNITDEETKEQMRKFFKDNQLPHQEIKALLEGSDLDGMLKSWNEGGFSQFSLTAVGIAIGRAYLEQKNFGNYDINIWIN